MDRIQQIRREDAHIDTDPHLQHAFLHSVTITLYANAIAEAQHYKVAPKGDDQFCYLVSCKRTGGGRLSITYTGSQGIEEACKPPEDRIVFFNKEDQKINS